METRGRRPSWRASLRTRLVVWFAAVLAVTLLVFAVFLHVIVRRTLWRELDLRLHAQVDNSRARLAPLWTIDGLTEPTFIDPFDDDGRWLEVWSPEGILLFRSPAAEARPVGLGMPSRPMVVSFTAPGLGHARALDATTDIIGLPVVMRVIESEERVRTELRDLVWWTAAGLGLCLGVAAWGGYRLARRALQPMERLVEQAASVTAERLVHQFEVAHTDDEVGVLATAFNDTMRRLNVSFEQARRFSADASHELRTPVTAIRTVGQVVLQAGADADVARYREAVGSIVEEAERLTSLLDTLLLLSRADAGRVEMRRAAVALDVLVRDVVTECEVLAEEKGQALTVDTVPASVDGDAGLLRLAITNLVDNAIRFTPSGGRIAVRVSTPAGAVRIDVQDTGPGIPAEHLPRLFDRFYRVDAGRARRVGGTGLGLSIVQWAIALHDGRVSVDSTPGVGSTFRIDVPM